MESSSVSSTAESDAGSIMPRVRLARDAASSENYSTPASKRLLCGRHFCCPRQL
jgi:hypothetical protein